VNTLLNSGQAQFKQKVSRLRISRRQLPILLVFLGLGIIAVVAGNILAGSVRPGSLGTKHIGWMLVGLAAFSAGIALDLTRGERYVARWLKNITNGRRRAGKFLAVSLELAFLTLVIREFRLGNQSFYEQIAVLVLAGFVIHYFLPSRYRLSFFLLLSLVGILSVFGLLSGTWLIGLGLALIGICHLPVRFSARVVLLLLTGGLLALMRMDRLHSPCPPVIWPILGSMFMFRLIIYMYDLRHDKGPMSIPAALSYFFLLPNIAFPLFPVVDYRTFRGTYYDSEQFEIYQRGVEWMFRGITHLLLYRFIYYYLTISPAEVMNVGDLARYLVTTFALYLWVSGVFHLIVGMLHLFGFHLPETNHRYFLASSFTDFWRRINIYWKDFMLKVFYYPAYFWLRRWGNTVAIVLSTVFVFVMTWFLHAYQWFWLRGSFRISMIDILFWTILGVLVVINSLYEQKYGRKRTLSSAVGTIGTFVPRVLRTLGTFAVITVLWAFWSSSSLSEWLSLWSFPAKKLPSIVGLIPAFFLAAIVLGAIPREERGGQPSKGSPKQSGSFFRSVRITGILIVLLYLLGKRFVYSHFGLEAQEIIRVMRVDELNNRDAALLQRGYYEDLRVERLNSQLWELYTKRPTNWPSISQTEASRQTGDFLSLELRPLAEIFFHGAPLRTNRWGMRDRDYEKAKLPKTYRYALLGASAEMGSGVADNQTFESLLEDRLNQENDGKGPYAKYEVLNFAVGTYTPLQQLWVLERKTVDFEPDAVLFAAHVGEEETSIRHLVNSIRAGVDIPYDYLNEVLRIAGVDRNTPAAVGEKRLLPYGQDVLAWAYRHIVEDCRKRGVRTVWIYISLPGMDTPKDSIAAQTRLARDAGFVTIDLSDWPAHEDEKSLETAEWDRHPNVKGHSLIAEKLYEALREKREIPDQQ
jgi:hypothetical protein